MTHEELKREEAATAREKLLNFVRHIAAEETQMEFLKAAGKALDAEYNYALARCIAALEKETSPWPGARRR